jgi:scavenger receptor class B, member 1
LSTCLLAGVFSLPQASQNDQIILHKGSDSFEWWSKPTTESTLKVYIFNVTNVEEFVQEGKKPKLKELGPYVYKMKVER